MCERMLESGLLTVSTPAVSMDSIYSIVGFKKKREDKAIFIGGRGGE